MLNDVTIERTFVTFKGNDSHIGSKLTYTFILLDGKVYLECIKSFERESNRHKWKQTRVLYSRLPVPRHIPHDDRTEQSALTMLPEGMVDEVLAKFRESIQLTTWRKP